MAFSTPSLTETRQESRDFLAAYLNGGAALPPNSRARVLSDDNAALAFGAYQFIQNLASQFLPDTADDVFLERWADIFLHGRQAATFANGTISLTGIAGTVVPLSFDFTAAGQTFETTAAVTLGVTPVSVAVRALAAGQAGNLPAGTTMAPVSALSGLDGSATVIGLANGLDIESIESLRDRVLMRIRQPPMGGDADDYVAWAREVPGVTRAWCSPNDMGPGTVGVRFMMDALRATTGGFPTSQDIAAVQANIDLKRPVSVQDFRAGAPVAESISFTVSNLSPNTGAIQAAIAVSVANMLRAKAAPARSVNGSAVAAQTIYAAWVSAAILSTPGVVSFDLTMADHAMPNKASIAVLGTITYV